MSAVGGGGSVRASVEMKPLNLLTLGQPPDRPPSPVNVTVTHLRANSATVSWDVPEGNIVIGYSISQQVRITLFSPTCALGSLNIPPVSSTRFLLSAWMLQSPELSLMARDWG